MTTKQQPAQAQFEANSEARANPTMQDVARLAGVSPMTVSRVMNGDGNVRAGTRQRVDAAVAALHYVPNQSARGLAGIKPIRLGFLYSNPSAGYLTEFLMGLLNQASLSNVQLVVEKCEAGERSEHGVEQARRLIANGIDGIILPPPLCDTDHLIELIAASSVPAVTVARGTQDARVCGISIDDYAAAYAMTAHLIALGHQRIGFVIGHPVQSASARRLAGYRAAINEFGADGSAELVTQGLFSYRSGLDAAELLLGLAQRPTAIFASNDDMAAATVWPELTTVRQPITEMAETAVRFLVRRVRAARAGEPEGPEHLVMDYALMRRQSDAAPRLRPPMPAVSSGRKA